MSGKNRSQYRAKCPHCKKSWLTDAYGYGVHVLECPSVRREQNPAQDIGPKRKKKKR